MGAVLSPCGLYRYSLSRDWGNGPKLAFVMLNPSTADAEVDDPTIRRCMGFARDGGYGGIDVGNLFAWRATDPAELKKAADPVGIDNDATLESIFRNSAVVVCGWGARGSLQGRDRHVLRLIRVAEKVPHCLRLTKAGHPAHPLYLPAKLRPIPMMP